MAQSSFTIGRVTADLELKTSERGNPYVRFSIAERIGYGQYAKTQFPQVWARGENAENLVKGKVSKGKLIWVSGTLELEEFQRTNGSPDKRLKIELKDWGYASDRKPQSGNTGGEPQADEAETKSPSNVPVGIIDGDRNELPD